MNCVIGIDYSLRGCGIVSIDETGDHQSGWYSSENEGDSLRAQVMRAEMIAGSVNIFIEQFTDIQGICIESYTVSQGGRVRANQEVVVGSRFLVVADICHASLYAGRDHFPLWEPAPMTLKKFAGSAKYDKYGMIAACLDLYSVGLCNHDVTDAYFLARLCGCALGWWPPLNNKQWEAVLTATGRDVSPQEKLRGIH